MMMMVMMMMMVVMMMIKMIIVKKSLLRVRQKIGDEVGPHVGEPWVRQVTRDDHIRPVSLTCNFVTKQNTQKSHQDYHWLTDNDVPVTPNCQGEYQVQGYGFET